MSFLPPIALESARRVGRDGADMWKHVTPQLCRLGCKLIRIVEGAFRVAPYIALGAAAAAAAFEIWRYKFAGNPPAPEEEVMEMALIETLVVSDPDSELHMQLIDTIEDRGDKIREALKLNKVQHRRVRRSKTKQFISCLRAHVKAEMGTPTYTTANMAVIRHIAIQYCREYNVRPESYAHLLDTVVQQVFEPYKSEYKRAIGCGSMLSRLKRWFLSAK